jgi:hypothetical protein
MNSLGASRFFLNGVNRGLPFGDGVAPPNFIGLRDWARSCSRFSFDANGGGEGFVVVFTGGGEVSPKSSSSLSC